MQGITWDPLGRFLASQSSDRFDCYSCPPFARLTWCLSLERVHPEHAAFIKGTKRVCFLSWERLTDTPSPLPKGRKKRKRKRKRKGTRRPVLSRRLTRRTPRRLPHSPRALKCLPTSPFQLSFADSASPRMAHC